MMRNGLTHHMAKHTAQRPPGEVSDKAKGHLNVMVPIVNDVNRDPGFTLNMDQTPMWYAMTAKGTIEHRGAPTVNIHTATGNGRRVTVAVTITASEHQLLSMIIFKGKPNERIAKKEVPTLPAGLFYKLNNKAWFNEQVMLNWVALVLKPYVATAPEGIIPVISLDMFSVHMMVLVVNNIQALSDQIQFILGGCTGLCQTVNVGYNKTPKAKMRTQFNKWLMAQNPNEAIHGATRHKLSEWIITAQANVSAVTIPNAWKKTGFSYYPNQPRE